MRVEITKFLCISVDIDLLFESTVIFPFQDVPVEFEFLRIFEDIKVTKPNFKLKHGPVLSSGNTADDLGKPAIHPYKRKEPVLILDQHIVVNDKRLLDILKTYDREGDHMIQPDDFISAVEVSFELLTKRKKIDRSKFKAFADDKLNVAKIMIPVFDRVKHCGNGKKGWLATFSPFPTLFSKGFSLSFFSIVW